VLANISVNNVSVTLSSTQLQKVSVTLWFCRLQCFVKRSVLSVFIDLRSAVCVYSMDFMSGWSRATVLSCYRNWWCSRCGQRMHWSTIADKIVLDKVDYRGTQS